MRIEVLGASSKRSSLLTEYPLPNDEVICHHDPQGEL